MDLMSKEKKQGRSLYNDERGQFSKRKITTI